MGTIELKIGEIKYGLKCIEDVEPGCLQCYFFENESPNLRCIDMSCISDHRKDMKGVHFIKVRT